MRAGAEAAAAAAGRAVDRVLRIEVQNSGGGPIPLPSVAMMREAASDAPPIATGQLEVRAQVTVTSILK